MNHPELEDPSPMPFGKYKGTPMQDVPAKYLLWLYDQGTRDDVMDYINRTMTALRMECPDYTPGRK